MKSFQFSCQAEQKVHCVGAWSRGSELTHEALSSWRSGVDPVLSQPAAPILLLLSFLWLLGAPRGSR